MKSRLSLFQTCLALTFAFSSFAPFAAHAAALPNQALIKSPSSSAVYYVEDGKRYAFPNDRVFLSWYPNFSSVVKVADSDLANYQLAGSMTYRPGMRLVKITTDPRVYAVSRYGVLRWVNDEALATKLFGMSWNKYIDDISDALFASYLVGDPITAPGQYVASEELMVSISANRRPANFTPPVNPIAVTLPNDAASNSIVVGVSTAQAVPGQTVLVFAKVSNPSRAINKIDIYDTMRVEPVKSCVNTNDCGALYTIPTEGQHRFRAIATNDQGMKIETIAEQEATVTVVSATANIQLTATPQTLSAGTQVSLSSDAHLIDGITGHKIFIVIPGEPNAILWKDCGTQTVCTISTPLYRTSQFFARIFTSAQTWHSNAVTVSVTSGTVPKPTLKIIDRPTAHQVTLRLDAPSGETIGWSTIVLGKTVEDDALALCDKASCEVTIQFSTPQTYTAFTEVGGKAEASESVDVTP